MNQRILIFQDGAKFKSPPEKWRFINVLTHALIKLIQEPGFEYVMIDPMICAEKLGEQISPDDFSCAIDLSGLFTKNLRQRGIPTFDEFKISRLRKTSSPLLDGVGFMINVQPDKITRIRDFLQSSNDQRSVLLLDDVGWSGRTVRQAITMLGLQKDRTTVAFLAGNMGTFGPAKTEIEKLKDEGFRVALGEKISTPQDDGFHLADFTIGDETNFDAILEIQELREALPSTFDEEHDKERKRISEAIQKVLEREQRNLFPNAISSEQAKRLAKEGRLIAKGGVSANSFFDVNPPNWLMPSFAMRISSKTLVKNRRDIIGVASELRDALSVHKEHEEARREITIRGGKERL